MNRICIDGRMIGEDWAPYIIAEIGVNHEGSMNLAKRLVREAKDGGADAVKFQAYKAEKIAAKASPAYWDTTREPTDSQYALFKRYDMFNARDYEELASYCKKMEIGFLATPFDMDAVDFLDPLVAAFKIASADITNIPLLRKVGGRKKTILMSTGASSLVEIEAAVETLRGAGGRDLALLHCVLRYPTPEEHAQLGMITILKRVFTDCVIGYSDHVVPDTTVSALEAATLLGACVLEKHFTHDKTLEGNDHYHSMDQYDLKRFIAKVEKYRRLILTPARGRDLSVESSARRNARRSIVAACDIRAGEMLSEGNLIAKRPGYGISPVHWDDVVGKRVARDVGKDELLFWNMIED